MATRAKKSRGKAGSRTGKKGKPKARAAKKGPKRPAKKAAAKRRGPRKVARKSAPKKAMKKLAPKRSPAKKASPATTAPSPAKSAGGENAEGSNPLSRVARVAKEIAQQTTAAVSEGVDKVKEVSGSIVERVTG